MVVMMMMMMMIMVENTVNDYLQPLLVLSLQSERKQNRHIFFLAANLSKDLSPPPKKKTECDNQSEGQFFASVCSMLGASSLFAPFFFMCHSTHVWPLMSPLLRT